jgi:replication factor C subunit 3/5
MSDVEDDQMNMDSGAIQFSSNNSNAKGKRTHANLPVEAEDTLPW